MTDLLHKCQSPQWAAACIEGLEGDVAVLQARVSELERNLKMLKNVLFDTYFQHCEPTKIVREYMKLMQWSPSTTEHEKNLVIGNLNGFVAWLTTLQDTP